MRSIVVMWCVFIFIGGACKAQSVPAETLAYWREKAPTCETQGGFIFPSKKQSSGECDDGDMTLFAGLLCAAGEQIGCETVRRAQDESGRWFRSPRRALSNNLGQPNSFSPDMALGAQLYLAMTKDKPRGDKWLAWMNRVRPCLIGSGDNCFQSPLLRFCTDDEEKGCTVRPGDAAMLDASVRFVPLAVPTVDMNNLLMQAGTNRLDLLWAAGQLNEPGFSQHLVAAEILLLRQMGYNDPRLDTAAFTLATKQPRNPFFAYLKEGKSNRVLELTLASCPAVGGTIPADRTQWAWERADSDEAWKKGMLWDCVFMGKLLEPK